MASRQLSPSILTIGGRLGYEDDAQTPNTLVMFHDYEKAPLIMEVRGLPEKTGSHKMDNYKGGAIGIVVECEGGYVLVPSYEEYKAFDKDGQEIKKGKRHSDHFENFINAVRSRNDKELHAPIFGGHLSTALCHTGNISYRLGHKQSPDAIREQIKGNSLSTASFQRMAEHLAANDVDLEKIPATLGVPLRMDQANEQIYR